MRPIIAVEPALFGRKRADAVGHQHALVSAGDVRLFLTTFAAGFVFVLAMIA